MLSEETNKRLKQLAAHQDDYRPNAATRQLLSTKTLIMLVGATCMGKSTLMDALAASDPSIAVVGTRTSRQPRRDDTLDRYTFYPHTDEGVAPFLAAIEQGEAVQYAINPYNGFIYGSLPADYKTRVSIGDYFSAVIDSFKTYGFARIHVMSIVTNPEIWLDLVDGRFPKDDPQRPARFAEAADSLRWSLAQTEGEHNWIVNYMGDIDKVVEQVHTVLQGHSLTSTEAVALAEACLEASEAVQEGQ